MIVLVYQGTPSGYTKLYLDFKECITLFKASRALTFKKIPIDRLEKASLLRKKCSMSIKLIES